MADIPAHEAFRTRGDPDGRDRRHGALLREMLLRRRGWSALEGDGCWSTFRGRRFLVTPLAAGEGWRAFLGERPGHADAPDYLARQELHRRVECGGERVVTIFTDAAGTRRVWGWTRRSPLVTNIYLEEHRGSDADEAWLPDARPHPILAPAHETDAIREGAEVAATALLRRLRACRSLAPRLRTRALNPASLCVRAVAGSLHPRVARRVWRELERVRVLDADCGRGEWLLGCYEALVTVGLACLGRMRAWVEEPPPGRRRRRLDQFSDFRLLLARSAETGAEGVRERFIGEVVLLRCLLGVAADAADAGATRALLASRLGGPLGGPDLRDLVRVAVGPFEGGGGWMAREAAEAERSGVQRAGWRPRRPAVEADLLTRAEEQIIRMRLQLGGSVEDLLEGIEEVRMRRARLSALPQWGEEVPESCRPSSSIGGAGAFDAVRLPSARTG